LSALSAGDLSPSNTPEGADKHEPLNAVLPDQQAGQADKAVTSHRTPQIALDIITL